LEEGKGVSGSGRGWWFVRGEGAYEEVFAGDEALADGAADAFACAGLVVVLLHGGRVDAPEAGLDGLVDEPGGAFLFPGGAVHHGRHGRGVLGGRHGVL
jgi:hypothetical protein